jgi:hypothetical protein
VTLRHVMSLKTSAFCDWQASLERPSPRSVLRGQLLG